MCVQIAISQASQTLWEHKRCWHFQLTANSCFWVMSTVEANGTGCSHVFFFFFWLQPEKGNTSKDCSLPSDARPSGQTFFSFLQQNMVRYPGHLVAVGKTQFMLHTVGFAAADSQVSTFQVVSTLLLIVERETETHSQAENVLTVSCILSLFNIWSFWDNQ